MARVEDITTVQEFDAAVSASTAAVVHFWASWCEPCTQVDQVLSLLASNSSDTRFLRVEAEADEVADLAERYDVSAVPHCLVFKGGKVVAAVEGADAPGLAAAVTSHVGGATSVPDSSAAAARHMDAVPAAKDLAATGAAAVSPVQGPIAQQNGAAAASDGGKAALNKRIEGLLASAPVVLFMKGSPEQPRCGFSSQVVQALQSSGTAFRHFDILQDNAVREGLKEYSNWPTYPQLYVNGELLGGADIVLEMAAGSELQEALSTASSADKADDDLQQRLKQLTTRSSVMLFLKGSKEQPFCKFSRAAVAALQATGTDFDTFDILQDNEVREGLKEYSNWPTYPQLYVGGELLGGADIIAELAESGVLKDAVAS